MSGCEHTVSPYSARIVTVDAAPYACIFCEMKRLSAQLAAQVAANEELRRELANARAVFAGHWDCDRITSERDSLTRRLAEVEAERDAMKQAADSYAHTIGLQYESVARIEQRTAEAIAAWLDRMTPSGASMRDFGVQNERVEAVAEMLASDIRAGAWRPTTGSGT